MCAFERSEKGMEFNMNVSDLLGYNLIGLSSSLAILISENMSAIDIGILASFIVSLGDNLAVLATTKALRKKK